MEENEYKPLDTWSQFLRARALLIDEWKAEGRTDLQIASILSMDSVQVYLISARNKAGDPPSTPMRYIPSRYKDGKWVRLSATTTESNNE